MKVLRSSRAMSAWAEERRLEGRRLALVPTMGALHAGHVALIRRARRVADCVMVSIYVNPTQFCAGEDFEKYPRVEHEDVVLCKQEGVDVVFAPRNLYADDASTRVEETMLSRDRCGISRPGHFAGVATVVAKLFNICRPHVAVFGLKDFQQCQVIQRMVRDLDFGVRLVFVPTVRERDGLAMSSRNRYLSEEERRLAPNFYRILCDGVRKGMGEKIIARELEKVGFQVDYVTHSGGRLCAAVFLGSTRLIDNVPLKKEAEGD